MLIYLKLIDYINRLIKNTHAFYEKYIYIKFIEFHITFLADIFISVSDITKIF